VTTYLLDENVIREMRPGGNAQVCAWFASVDDSDLRVSASTFYEKRLGWERQRRKLADAGQDTGRADAALAAIAQFEADFASREIVMDSCVMAEVARLLGTKQKNERDAVLAATARVHDLVLVTRNVKDFRGRGVRLLNPFDKTPRIVPV
jgi:predicted nucleic acid-binding protein